MRWTSIAMAAAAAFSGSQTALAASGACPNPAFQKQAQAALGAFSQSDVFSGAVLVAVDGKPVLRQGVGLANRELGVPATPQMKFRIGSITKQFTATAILQLQEAGKLSIDDPVSQYYPDAPPAWSKITLRHLLTHTSGIPTYTALPGFFGREAREAHTPEELIKLTRDKPLQFEPGKGYAYDNSGYVLLGYVVEKASGQRYADYVQQHIFTPVGMTSSGYDDSQRMIPGRASGYDRAPDGSLQNAAFLDMSVPYAAGSLYSTVDDLLAWDQAIYAAKLLKPESLKAQATDYGHSYGFGFQVDKKWGQDRIWHNGGINGFTASFQRYPGAHVTAIALNNQQSGATDKVAADLAGLCLGAEVYPKEVAAAPADLQRYAGYYEAQGAPIVRLEARGGALVSHVAGQPEALFYPAGGARFFSKIAEAQLTFQAGADGQVTGALVAQGPGPGIPAKKVDAAEADRFMKAQLLRASATTAQPGAEAALRKFILDVQKGQPDYAHLGPGLANVVRQTLDQVRTQTILPLGDLKSLTFQSAAPNGMDNFTATFEKGSLQMGIALGDGGMINGLLMRPAG